MENTQIVHVLHVTLSEVETYRRLLGFKMEGVEGFGLGFGDRWDIGGPRECLEACECSAGVLDYQSFGRGAGGGLIVEEWTGGVWLFRVAEADGGWHVSRCGECKR